MTEKHWNVLLLGLFLGFFVGAGFGAFVMRSLS
jgi:hypothetical protein